VPEFKPFIPADSTEREFTLKAILAGIVMAAVFGAANAYLGMKAGQTVAATIPAAVIAIALFRLPFFRGGVLEQNLTRTAASVGEALVAGAIFTIPAFIMVNVNGERLWTDFRGHYWETTVVMLAGGLLGIFFIIILRRPLCVESDLPFPESVASAEVVKAGQAGATDAPKYVFGALGLGALLQILKDDKGLQLFKDTVSGFIHFPSSRINYFGFQKEPIGSVDYTGGIAYSTPSASPALIGIGYIIGPRLAVLNFSGGVLAWVILIPLILFIDPGLPQRLGATSGGTAPWDLLSYTVWYNVVRPIAVGAMLVGAVHTLYGMRGPILRSLKGAFESTLAATHAAALRNRLDTDIPIKWIMVSIAVLLVPITLIYYHFAQSWKAAILAAVVMALSGFLLGAVGGYLVGLMGTSNQPVSGLILSALVLAAVVMVAIGARGIAGVGAVVGVASVVGLACSVSGSLIQDLKAGHLLGGTPWKMEAVEILSVIVLSFFLFFPIIALHEANRATGGIGGRLLPAPQAGLVATLSQGIVGGQMAWGLVLMGAVLGIFLIMIQAPSPMLIAVGMYLPLETTGAICVGGLLKWAADQWAARRKLEGDAKAKFEERGTLLASGFIAGEAITGILLATLFLTGISSITHVFTGQDVFPFVEHWGGWISLVAFAIVAYVLVWIPVAASRAKGQEAP
jgi:putative OPT family oligopeptide transporter